MSRPKRPITRKRSSRPWTEFSVPAIETRPVTVRRMTPGDYRQHEELVRIARRKAGTQIKKPLY